MPGDDDDRELEALGGVHRHQPHARFLGARCLVGLRQQRQPIDEAAEGRPRLARFVLARGRHELHQVLDPAFASSLLLLAQIRAGSRTGRASMPMASTRSTPAASAESPAIRSRNVRERGERARRQSPLVERHERAAPTAIAATARAAGRRPGAAWSAPSASGSIASSASMTRLADAARRHVDHPPEADVVVRVDHEPQVGERVLDLLALVEPDAADDAVARRPRASARLQSRATARWCGRAPPSSCRAARRAASRIALVMKSASSISSPARK